MSLTEEILSFCRYGDLADVKKVVDESGPSILADAFDESGNSVLHMVCGNGHLPLLEYLLPIIPPSLMSTCNKSGSTPLHWAVLNSHLPVVKKLVLFPGGPGKDLLDIKNLAGHSPLTQAEMSGWEQGAQWLTQVMNLESDAPNDNSDEDDPEEMEDVQEGVGRMSVDNPKCLFPDGRGKNPNDIKNLSGHSPLTQAAIPGK